MSKNSKLILCKLYSSMWCNPDFTIGLRDGQIELSPKKFVAVGLKKSRTATNIEDSDYFEAVVLTKAINGKYYLLRIEHSAYLLSPKYIEDELNIYWVEENNYSDKLRLIDNLYTLDDSRSDYTLTVSDQPYQIYEKYITYTMSVSYEIWKNRDRSVEVSPYFHVHCQFGSHWHNRALEDLPTNMLKYQINIFSLLRTSIFNFKPFELWEGDVQIDGVEVTLKPNQ